MGWKRVCAVIALVCVVLEALGVGVAGLPLLLIAVGLLAVIAVF